MLHYFTTGDLRILSHDRIIGLVVPQKLVQENFAVIGGLGCLVSFSYKVLCNFSLLVQELLMGYVSKYLTPIFIRTKEENLFGCAVTQWSDPCLLLRNFKSLHMSLWCIKDLWNRKISEMFQHFLGIGRCPVLM
jgi:hypothetical protein